MDSYIQPQSSFYPTHLLQLFPFLKVHEQHPLYPIQSLFSWSSSKGFNYHSMWITITPSEMTSHFSLVPHLKATSTWLFYAHQFQYVQYFSHHLPHKTSSSFQLLVMKPPTSSGEKSWNHLLTLSSPSSSMYPVVASLQRPCLSPHWPHCSLSSLSLFAWITPRASGLESLQLPSCPTIYWFSASCPNDSCPRCAHSFLHTFSHGISSCNVTKIWRPSSNPTSFMKALPTVPVHSHLLLQWTNTLCQNHRLVLTGCEIILSVISPFPHGSKCWGEGLFL